MCMSSDKHSNCLPATCAAASALLTLSVSIIEGKKGNGRGNTVIKLDY
jgi:hypothetical protein